MRLCKWISLPYINAMSGNTENIDPNSTDGTDNASDKVLSPEAQRALAEAEARRLKAQAEADNLPKEQGGRGGPDPARYGDWEINGRAIDF